MQNVTAKHVLDLTAKEHTASTVRPLHVTVYVIIIEATHSASTRQHDSFH